MKPLLPAGRQVALAAPAKSGKSLLALEISAALATGRAVLGQAAGEPQNVAYIDAEMTIEDLRERLFDLGYGPDVSLDRLAYFLLPDLPALDSAAGGEALAALVERHAAALVVIDTTSSLVHGPENSADTTRDFFRHTGSRLKAEGVALLRLDHTGKDPSRGQRGSSAKGDDVDVVFQLTAAGDQVTLTRLKSRIPWVPPEIRLRREVAPRLRHVLIEDDAPAAAWAIVALLDGCAVPLDATADEAIDMLRSAGLGGRRKQHVLAALSLRRAG